MTIKSSGDVIKMVGGRFQTVRETFPVFMVGGQSNAAGVGDEATSYGPVSMAYEYTLTDTIKNPVETQVGENWGADAWVAFCETFCDATGVEIGIVGCSRSASAQCYIAKPELNWDDGGELFDWAVNRTQTALSAFANAGKPHPYMAGVLWHQGEQDVASADVTKAMYKSALENMIAKFRAAFSSFMPFYIFNLGQGNEYDPAKWADIRAAQQEVAAADPYTHIVFECLGLPLKDDGVHYTTAGLEQMGVGGAESVALLF